MLYRGDDPIHDRSTKKTAPSLVSAQVLANHTDQKSEPYLMQTTGDLLRPHLEARVRSLA
jgi:hypothetical protein